jgi:tRNA(Ile)-lysidine synthase
LQAAARDLRYRAMMEIAEECGADRIAVGHTADDQAETVLLWMLRGAGLTGLSGMPAFRDGKIIRPLYETKRQDILAYLTSAGISFRQDSSNAKPLYMRNRIRQEVIPILKRLVPSSADALCRLADVCREDDRCLDERVAVLCSTRVRREIEGGWSIERAFVRELPLALQRRLVRNVLRGCDALHRPASFSAVERILHAVTAKGTYQGMAVKSTRLVVGKDLVQFIPSGSRDLAHAQRDQVAATILVVPGRIVWTGTGQTIRVQQQARSQVRTSTHGRSCVVVDADRVSGPLVVRGWQPGDRFHPLGMKGRSKKLQDYFTDLKVPVAARRQIPVVVAPEGIVWVVGYRQDERWTLTAASRRCLVITASEESTGAREGV